MPTKWKFDKIEMNKTKINANEYDEKLEIIARVLYKYFCQLKKVNPTEDLDIPNLSTKKERAA